MLARIGRDVLLKALSHVHGVAPAKPSVPVLGRVRLDADIHQGAVAMTATDLDRAALARADGEIKTGGVTTAPAHRLRDLVRRIPSGTEIVLRNGDGRLVIEAGGFRAEIPAMPPEEFPGIGGIEPEVRFEIAGRGLARLIAKAWHAIPSDGARHYLNGLFLAARDGALVAAATDGHRLVELRTDPPDGAEGLEGIIVPRAAAADLKRLAADAGDEPVFVMTDGRRLSASNRDGLGLVTRLVDGRFPDYERVIPKEPRPAARIPRGALLAAVERAAVFAGGGCVRLDFGPDGVTVSVEDAEGTAGERIGCGFEGEPTRIGFNPRYLREMLGVMEGGHVEIRPGTPMAPVLAFDPEGDAGLRYVIMPMRV